MIHRLTAFQAEEVSGLLDVAADEVGMGTEGWAVWGVLRGFRLEVTDAKAAAEDLEQRALFLEQEADNPGAGTRQAESLRRLAVCINAG